MPLINRIVALFHGRLSRKAYALYWFLPVAIFLVLTEYFIPAEVYVAYAIPFDVLFFAIMAIDAPLGVRRFHDGGMSGWWFILPRVAALPFYFVDVPEAQETIALAVYAGVLALWWFWSLYRLIVRAGDNGPNRFGPDPLAPSKAAAQHGME